MGVKRHPGWGGQQGRCVTERPRVLVTRTLPEPVMEALRTRCEVDLYAGEFAIPRDELLTRARGVDGAVTLLTERIDAEFLNAAGPGLVIVTNYAVGYDNIDVPECTQRGVLVSNTPDVLTETTADLSLALLLAAARRIPEGDRFLRTGKPWIWGPQMLLGVDVHGSTLGIVGFGRIGKAVARRARGFGMRVIYTNRRGEPDAREADFEATWVNFDHLLATSDFVSIHCSLNDLTRHLFGHNEFRAMKGTAVLVNAARGAVVDEAALAQALQNGEIFAAGLDVFEREPEVHPSLLECENAIIVPHLGSATVDTRTRMGMLAAENLFAALEGRRPPNLVNPEVRRG
jgi:glyoxylate reductase